MAVIKVKKNKDYTVVNNSYLRDENLSLKTKGLMTIMLSLPDDWNYTIEGLSNLTKTGKDTIRTILNELEKNGYLVRARKRNSDGKLSTTEYTLYEKSTDSPVSEIPTLENLTLEKPTLEKPTQLNTNILNTNNKKIYKKELANDTLDKYLDNFNKFWDKYPKKQNKQKTINWFKKNNPNKELMSIILEKLELFKNTENWKKSNGQFIPLPTSWLNAKRWEDEIDIKEDKKVSTIGGYQELT